VKKNIIGSVVSTVSSFLNVFSVYYVEAPNADRCLLFYALDVMVNVLVMNFLISGGGNKRISADEAMRVPYVQAAESVKEFENHPPYSESRVYPSLAGRDSSKVTPSE
jgi:hypothetical protein